MEKTHAPVPFPRPHVCARGKITHNICYQTLTTAENKEKVIFVEDYPGGIDEGGSHPYIIVKHAKATAGDPFASGTARGGVYGGEGGAGRTRAKRGSCAHRTATATTTSTTTTTTTMTTTTMTTTMTTTTTSQYGAIKDAKINEEQQNQERHRDT